MRFPIKSATVALAIAASSSTLFAADLLRAPFSPPQNDDVPVELGTGWYIRGDLDFARENAPVLTADLGSTARNLLRNNIAAGGGFGYQFNNWIRTDVTAEFRRQKTTFNGTDVIACPYTIAGVSDANGNPVGIAGLFNNCGSRQTASLQRMVGLVNGYVDLGNWWHIAPYVGAGVGISYTRLNGAVNYYNLSDGSPYDVTTSYPNGFPPIWINSPPVPVGHINWDRTITSRQVALAWALMAGVAYDLTPHAKIDVGYRYLNMGRLNGVASVMGGTSSNSSNTTAQEVRVGLRYVID
ncbi:MAG: porin family protein [Methylobacteriaceae bacterium]|nr:porin family protein [Methylobacteriaceae bacterium]